jgi:hypothetical protein
MALMRGNAITDVSRLPDSVIGNVEGEKMPGGSPAGTVPVDAEQVFETATTAASTTSNQPTPDETGPPAESDPRTDASVTGNLSLSITEIAVLGGAVAAFFLLN